MCQVLERVSLAIPDHCSMGDHLADYRLVADLLTA